MIFITGASGLLGSSLIEILFEKHNGPLPLQIRALYRKQIPAIQFADKIEWIEGDVLDVVVLEEALKGVEQVYHCAAIVSFDPKQKQKMHATNVEGTANVVNACIDAGVKKLLFVSSVAALGRIREEGSINETMNWSEATSNSEYGKTKYLAEMEVWRGIGEGLDAVIVNPVIILGCGDWNGGSSGIFKSAYDRFPWYTSGVSGFVDVKDVSNAMNLLMNSNISAQRFIISGHNTPYRTIFNLIADAFKVPRPYKKVTPLLAAIVWRLEAVKAFFTGSSPLLTKETTLTAQASVYFDNSKLLNALPDFSYTPLEDTINRVVNELIVKYNLKT
ncbi:MAG: NAD-dependent epimerase/dehydratase family protein [Bacteroidetes bacterium]|nr:NAD-dependent epimerase/dehydratase family protein [Bacteroidota bacterium]